MTPTTDTPTLIIIVTWNGNRIQGWILDSSMDNENNPVRGSIQNGARAFLDFLARYLAELELGRGRHQVEISLDHSSESQPWSARLL